MQTHRTVTRDEWLLARKALLQKEKELTRARDRLAAERRALPWVRIDKPYVFDAAEGKRSLADLFEGRGQLILQHFMFGPDWQEGCVGCSFQADHADGAIQHLNQHDVAYVAVSRAPIARIEAYRRRMGWRFAWVSSADSDFNFDFHVSFTEAEKAKGRVTYNFAEQDYQADELSGISTFIRGEDGQVFHTYSTHARGAELLIGTYNYLDLTPKGRNETINGNLTDWVRHHDRYGASGHVDTRSGRFQGDVGGAVASEGKAACCHD